MLCRQPPLTPQFRASWAQSTFDSPPPALPRETEIEYTIGLDLGKSHDYSALCVVERAAPPTDEVTYAIRHLYRWPLGTSYTQVANDVADLVYKPSLKLPRIAADKTGVGTAVMEMIEQAIDARAGEGGRAELCPVLITGGHGHSRAADLSWHVAKVELVSVLQAYLSSRRLKISNELPHAEVLVAELTTFSTKITLAGNESFEAWRERDHDDMVLAVAMALWLAENAPRGRFEVF